MVAGNTSHKGIGSTTASDSFLDLKWRWSDGTAFHDDPLLMVTETTAADRAAFAAETARVFAITTITVAGHTGPCAGEMGTYRRNAEHSPKNGGNVYTKTDDSDTHFFRSDCGDWIVGNTAGMIEGTDTGSSIASLSHSHSPLDLEWEIFDGGGGFFQPDPLLKITGF
jgi:hypothetical protein